MNKLKLNLVKACESIKEGEKLALKISKSEDMNLLPEKVKTINNQLSELKKIIGKNKDMLEKYPDQLKEISKKYRDKRMKIISSNLHEVFVIIRGNLVNGIVGEIDDKNKCLTLKKEEIKECTEIGKVICINSEQNKFKVTLNGENIKKYEEEFELDSLSEICEVATSINANIS